MAEINNNITNFGRNIEKINKPEDSSQNTNDKQLNPEQQMYEQNEITDTGVLGRSQVKTVRSGDISKSVDEAVKLAEERPAVLGCCESLFNCLYKDYLESGMEPSEAYIQALFGEQELLNMVKKI